MAVFIWRFFNVSDACFLANMMTLLDYAFTAGSFEGTFEFYLCWFLWIVFFLVESVQDMNRILWGNSIICVLFFRRSFSRRHLRKVGFMVPAILSLSVSHVVEVSLSLSSDHFVPIKWKGLKKKCRERLLRSSMWIWRNCESTLLLKESHGSVWSTWRRFECRAILSKIRI